MRQKQQNNFKRAFNDQVVLSISEPEGEKRTFKVLVAEGTATIGWAIHCTAAVTIMPRGISDMLVRAAMPRCINANRSITITKSIS